MIFPAYVKAYNPTTTSLVVPDQINSVVYQDWPLAPFTAAYMDTTGGVSFTGTPSVPSNYVYAPPGATHWSAYGFVQFPFAETGASSVFRAHIFVNDLNTASTLQYHDVDNVIAPLANPGTQSWQGVRNPSTGIVPVPILKHNSIPFVDTGSGSRTFTLTVNGVTTAPIAFSTTATTLAPSITAALVGASILGITAHATTPSVATTAQALAGIELAMLAGSAGGISWLVGAGPTVTATMVSGTGLTINGSATSSVCAVIPERLSMPIAQFTGETMAVPLGSGMWFDVVYNSFGPTAAPLVPGAGQILGTASTQDGQNNADPQVTYYFKLVSTTAVGVLVKRSSFSATSDAGGNLSVILDMNSVYKYGIAVDSLTGSFPTGTVNMPIPTLIS